VLWYVPGIQDGVQWAVRPKFLYGGSRQ
jgi:hypothetical protein